MDNSGCSSHDWNVIASANPNSQLAGVLAGFVFSGLVILLGRPGPKSAQAMGLFCAAFVCLSFDSYTYGLLVGENNNGACARIWSEAMPAGGMLGVGGVAAISGIGWLLAGYLDETSIKLDEGVSAETRRNLHRLSLVMMHGISFAVSLLLVSATIEYLDKVLVHGAARWMAISVFAVPLAVAGSTIILAWIRARRLRIAAVPHVALADTVATTTTISAIGVLLYAIVGPIAAGGLFVNLAPTVWAPTEPWLVIIGIILGLVLPGALLVMLVLATPPLQTTRDKRHLGNDSQIMPSRGEAALPGTGSIPRPTPGDIGDVETEERIPD